MRIVEVTDDGKLTRRDIDHLGGLLNLWEVLKTGGIGSPKLIYESGIAAFDEIERYSSDLNYVSIELFQAGLAIRFKKRGMFKVALIKHDELEYFELKIQKAIITIRGRDHTTFLTKVTIALWLEGVIQLLIPSSYYRSGTNFFFRGPLKTYTKVTRLPGAIRTRRGNIG